MTKHQTLHVAICDNCKEQHMSENKWHDSKEWTERDDKGKCIYCEICGEGGTLLPCDMCEFSYCTNKCLKTWMGDRKLEELLEDEKITFECFHCLHKKRPDAISTTFPNYEKFLKQTEKQFKQPYTKKPKASNKKYVESDEFDDNDHIETDSDIDLDNLPSPPAPSSSRKKKASYRELDSDEEREDSSSDDEKPLKPIPAKKSTPSPIKKVVEEKYNAKETSKPFTCFSCFEKQTMTPSKLPKMHPSKMAKCEKDKLKIVICDKCYNYVDSDDWTYTEGKSDYCVISGEGGEIYS